MIRCDFYKKINLSKEPKPINFFKKNSICPYVIMKSFTNPAAVITSFRKYFHFESHACEIKMMISLYVIQYMNLF